MPRWWLLGALVGLGVAWARVALRVALEAGVRVWSGGMAQHTRGTMTDGAKVLLTHADTCVCRVGRFKFMGNQQ